MAELQNAINKVRASHLANADRFERSILDNVRMTSEMARAYTDRNTRLARAHLNEDNFLGILPDSHDLPNNVTPIGIARPDIIDGKSLRAFERQYPDVDFGNGARGSSGRHAVATVVEIMSVDEPAQQVDVRSGTSTGHTDAIEQLTSGTYTGSSVA